MSDTEKTPKLSEHRALEAKMKIYGMDKFTTAPKTGKQRRRLTHAFNREFGAALLLRGAVKKSKLKKLAALAEGFDGYSVPEQAQKALDSYVK